MNPDAIAQLRSFRFAVIGTTLLVVLLAGCSFEAVTQDTANPQPSAISTAAPPPSLSGYLTSNVDLQNVKTDLQHYIITSTADGRSFQLQDPRNNNSTVIQFGSVPKSSGSGFVNITLTFTTATPQSHALTRKRAKALYEFLSSQPSRDKDQCTLGDCDLLECLCYCSNNAVDPHTCKVPVSQSNVCSCP